MTEFCRRGFGGDGVRVYNKDMTQVQAVQIWLNGAEEALTTALILLQSKRYDHCLFFGQLYLEKLLKALTYHLIDDHPIPTHNLVQLCAKISISLSEDQKKELREISSFNTTARYPEDKSVLYKKATREFAVTWFKKIEEYGNYFKSYLAK